MLYRVAARVWAALDDGPDGICLDADGAVWAASMKRCVRVREGGEVLERVELDEFCFACMLGGDDGRSLFLMAAEWLGVENFGQLLQSRSGKVLAVRAPAPRAGWL